MGIRRWFRDISKKRPEASRFIGQSSVFLFDRMVRMAVGLVLGALIARHLGVAGFGQMAFIVASVSFVQSLVTLGLDGIVVKRFVDSPTERGVVFGSAATMRLIAGALAWLLLMGFMWRNTQAEEYLPLISIYAMTLFVSALDVGDLWFQATQRAPLVVFAKLFVFGVFAIVRLTLVWYGAGISGFIVAMTFELLLAGACAWWLMLRKNKIGQSLTFSNTVAKDLLRSSWPLIISGAMVSVYMRFDQLLIARILGTEQLGLYAAALRLSEVWQFLSMSLAAAAAPAIAKARMESVDAFERRIVKLFRAVFLLGLGVAVFVSMAATPVMLLMFGPAFSKSAQVLAVHIWHIPFMFLGSAVSLWMINQGMTKLFLLKAAIGAGFSLVLNITLLPLFGIMGAAVSAIVVQLCANFLWHPLLPSTRRLFQLQCSACFGWPAFGSRKDAL